MSETCGPHQRILGTLTKYISKDNIRPPHKGDLGFTELLDAFAGGKTIDNCSPHNNLVASVPWAVDGMLNTQAL